MHYRVTRKTNRRIRPGELLLIDSGAQYQDGTTDVTRTIAVGDPTPEMRDRFTRVLRGHLAIARAVFPDGTTGAQIDAFARQYLWQVGLDFEHGTGHGVGSYLSVHEGPARISKLGTTPLKRGMILSNEPGYYKTNAYGIRIENLELVVAEGHRRRGEADERFFGAHARADRSSADRRPADDGRRDRLARRIPRPRARRRCAARWMMRPVAGWRRRHGRCAGSSPSFRGARSSEPGIQSLELGRNTSRFRSRFARPGMTQRFRLQ